MHCRQVKPEAVDNDNDGDIEDFEYGMSSPKFCMHRTSIPVRIAEALVRRASLCKAVISHAERWTEVLSVLIQEPGLFGILQIALQRLAE
jgi:hypothetical protein